MEYAKIGISALSCLMVTKGHTYLNNPATDLKAASSFRYVSGRLFLPGTKELLPNFSIFYDALSKLSTGFSFLIYFFQSYFVRNFSSFKVKALCTKS